MPEIGASATTMTQAMAGGGAYDRNSDYQLHGALTHRQRILEAAAGVRTAGREAIVLADYGCAQGRVSDPLLREALQVIRRAAPTTPCFVVHNDQPSNDWAGLFARLANDDDSYLAAIDGPVTPLAAPVSFYQPVTPPGLVDLGISFAAIQWLAEPGPSDGGSGLYFDQLAEEAHQAMAAQADRDWTRFLALRADELAPGGRLVLDMMGIPDGGRAAGHDLWRIAQEVAEHLAGDGRIREDALVRYVLPVYERSVAEVRRPFEGAVGRHLELESLSIEPVPNPVLARFAEDADAEAMARDLTGFFRAFSEPSLRAGLGLDDEAAEMLFDGIESRVREQAGAITFDVHPIAVVARRIG